MTFVYDTDPARTRAAAQDGFRIWSRNDRVRFDVVIGCSGRASVTVSDRDFLEDGALLASASSGTVELSREDFIELADALPDDEIWIEREGLDETDLHSDLRLHLVDRDVTFANGGFPLNFDGRVNSVPAHYIQPTPTMMCAATVQAAAATTRGLIALEPAFCSWVEREFRRELGEEAGLVAAKVE